MPDLCRDIMFFIRWKFGFSQEINAIPETFSAKKQPDGTWKDKDADTGELKIILSERNIFPEEIDIQETGINDPDTPETGLVAVSIYATNPIGINNYGRRASYGEGNFEITIYGDDLADVKYIVSKIKGFFNNFKGYLHDIATKRIIVLFLTILLLINYIKLILNQKKICLILIIFLT